MMMITSKTSNECSRGTPCRWGGKTTLTAFNVRTDWRQFQRADTTSSEHHHRRRKKIEEEEEKKISRSFTVDALSTRASESRGESRRFFFWQLMDDFDDFDELFVFFCRLSSVSLCCSFSLLPTDRLLLLMLPTAWRLLMALLMTLMKRRKLTTITIDIYIMHIYCSTYI